MKEKDSEYLMYWKSLPIPLQKLYLYMSTSEPEEDIHDRRNVPNLNPPEKLDDLSVVFDRQLSNYQNQFPNTNVDDFKKGTKKHVEDLLGRIANDPMGSIIKAPILEWASVYVNNFLDPVQKELGIKGVLTREELESLYEKMQKKYVDSEKNNFIAALSGELLPDNFKPVKWIDISRTGKTAGSVNKSSLYAFLKAIKGSDQNIPVTLEDASKFIGKQKGSNKYATVLLNKPKSNDLYFQKNLKRFNDLIKACTVKR